MAFAALAQRSAAFSQTAGGIAAGVFHDRDEPDQHAGEQREREREEQDGKIDADLVNAR